MREETKKKLSDSLRAKWASGTRKPNPPETYIKASATHKRMYREGLRKPPHLSPERAREMAGMVNKETQLMVNRRIAKGKIGVPNPPGPSAATPDHWKAKYWIIKSPDQIIIEGKNLNHLIRENAHLFNPEDLNWHKSRCRASKGLRGLFEERDRPVYSWKGWMRGDT